jgi:hypothetical protein
MSIYHSMHVEDITIEKKIRINNLANKGEFKKQVAPQ